MEKVPFSQLHLSSLIGEGASSLVYRGFWNAKEIAIKKFKRSHLDDDEFDCFYNEANLLFTSLHPAVIKILGICTDPMNICILLEYAPLGSLDKLLRNSKISMPWKPLRLSIAFDISKGVSFLHSKNIIHRDIKSGNVLLDNNYRAKIADFGVAVLQTNVMTSKPVEQKLASIRWTAPEIFKGDARTKSSDVYSLGTTLWEISTRKLPFGQEVDNQIVLAWIKEGKQEQIPSDCPIASLIKECWKDAPDRPSASAIECALETAHKFSSIDDNNQAIERLESEIVLLQKQLEDLRKEIASTPKMEKKKITRARANFDYDAEEENGLSFKEGDSIVVTKEINGEWWEGTCNRRSGVFPVVKELPTPSQVQPIVQPIASVRKCQVIFDFDTHEIDELNIKEGEVLIILSEIDGWIFGLNAQGAQGFFPADYVQEIQ